ncbi:hypothetical protein [Micromonospora aurantiaca (nom. illeg.)]|uniref:hypothetical protein n=1 Tax=Micromonospora aurantiaca (nom. illeg.) TaxID=47850 RepID=UPI0036AB9452
MERKGINTHQVFEAGMSRVVAEIEKRGGSIERHGRMLTITTSFGSPNSPASIRAKVTSKTSGDWQTSTREGQQSDGDMTGADYWVFVDLGVDPSEFYIAPASWVHEEVAKRHRQFLLKHGGKRPVNPESVHHKIKTEWIAQWRHRWDLLGLPDH